MPDVPKAEPLEYRGVRVLRWGRHGWLTIAWQGNPLHGSSWTDDKARALIDWQLDAPERPNPFHRWLRFVTPTSVRPDGAAAAAPPPPARPQAPLGVMETPPPAAAEKKLNRKGRAKLAAIDSQRDATGRLVF